jgi:Uncharacterized protein conserved in bacteria (DUF2252)
MPCRRSSRWRFSRTGASRLAFGNFPEVTCGEPDPTAIEVERDLATVGPGAERALGHLCEAWGSLRGKDYYVRQFRDMKIIPTTELIAPRLAEFATACGETRARAHARTGDPVAIDGYIGKGPKFAAAIARFADRYGEQNERDHAQLVSAIAVGTAESLPG